MANDDQQRAAAQEAQRRHEEDLRRAQRELDRIQAEQAAAARNSGKK